MEYIIVGDAEVCGKMCRCLIYVCGKNKERAEEVLNKMLNNPDDNDLRVMKGHSNIRIATVEDKDCWWNDPVLCN